MDRPKNVRELLDYLAEYPVVRVSTNDPRLANIGQGVRFFREYARGGLWFDDEVGRRSYVPLDCTRTGAAARHETGVQFDEKGFAVEKFGATIRYDYVQEDVHAH